MNIKKISLLLCVTVIMTCVCGFTAGAETYTDSDYTYYSFMDGDASREFYDLYGDVKIDSDSNGWFMVGNGKADAETGGMLFSFDGSKTVTEDGAETKIKGMPHTIEYAIMAHAWGSSPYGTIRIEISENGSDWYTCYDSSAKLREYGIEFASVSHANAAQAVKNKYAPLQSTNAFGWAGGATYYTVNFPDTFTPSGESDALKIKFVKIGGVDITNVKRIFAMPTVTYKVPFSRFDVVNKNSVAAGRNIELEFSEDMDAETLIPGNFTVESESGSSIPVTAVEYDTDSKRALITLGYNMQKETVYTVTADSDVQTVDEAELTVKEGSFTTVGSGASVIFVDDMSDSSYLTKVNTTTAKNDPNFLEDGTLYQGKEGTSSWEFVFDGTRSVTQGDTTYTFDGVVKSLSYDYYTFASYSYAKNAQVLASHDGVEYTALTKTNVSSASGGAAMPGQSWVNYGTTTVSDIPEGTRYLKIEATGITNENNFLIGRITVEYETGVGDTYVRKTEIDHYNEQTKVYLTLFADADKNRILAENFSVDGITASDIEFSGSREIIVTVDKVLEFDTEYTIEISGGAANINGTRLTGTAFKTYSEPEIITASNTEQVLNGTELKVSTDITFNYKEGVKTMPVTLFTVVYKDDEIISKSVLDTKYVNSNTTESFENTVDINTSNGEYAVTFILQGDEGFYPLGSTLVYPKNN